MGVRMCFITIVIIIIMLFCWLVEILIEMLFHIGVVASDGDEIECRVRHVLIIVRFDSNQNDDDDDRANDNDSKGRSNNSD